MRSINLLDFLSPGDKIYSGGEVYEVAKTTNTDKLMEKNWVYRYSVQDDEVCGYDDEWSYSSKEEAMERLKKDYAETIQILKQQKRFSLIAERGDQQKMVCIYSMMCLM